ERRQVRIRVPHDRGIKRLRFHGIPETVKAPQPSAGATPGRKRSVIGAARALSHEPYQHVMARPRAAPKAHPRTGSGGPSTPFFRAAGKGVDGPPSRTMTRPR